MPSVLERPTFGQARAEIESLGFVLSDRPFRGSRPYGVIGGRSNERWWLVPLRERRVAVSGFAMFQPIIASAQILKHAAVATSWLGLPRLWARSLIHIGGAPPFEDIFGARDLRYAFFTGTESPHRKCAVQIMDSEGRLKGFAKATRNLAVKPLLLHEGQVLHHLQTLALSTALVPAVLYQGNVAGSEVLVTDTRKTTRSRIVTSLEDPHLAFLTELATKTAVEGPGDWAVAALARRCEAVSKRLTGRWRCRLQSALDRLSLARGEWGPRCLAHGDFTSTNTFFADGRLYVFDWEYASTDRTPGFDLVHFILASPSVRRASPAVRVRHACDVVARLPGALGRPDSATLLLGYLCGHALRFAQREPGFSLVETWSGEIETAALLDALLARN